MFAKLVPAIVLSAVLAVPAVAQDDSPPLSEELQEGIDIIERGTRLLLESLIEDLGPAWAELRHMLNELNSYHPPEILPNGDIIIRRKVPLAPPEPDDSETEL